MEQIADQNDIEKKLYECRIRLGKGEYNIICAPETKKTLGSVYRDWVERLIESY
jgi:hypothetical protein